MRISDLIARIVTERRAYVWLGVIAGLRLSDFTSESGGFRIRI